jgi:hypothetical protein
MNVDTGVFEAITGQVGKLEAAVAQLAERVEQSTRVESILRRADWPALPAQLPAARDARPRHLKAVR